MEKEEVLNVALPKWPAFVVKGVKVTKEQAQEILIRTDHFHFSTNDHEFEKELYAALGFPYIPHDTYGVLTEEQRKKFDQLKKDLHLLSANTTTWIAYLENNQICSSWIGGPHGWCSWDGYIGTNIYNIGKYPTCEEVLKEWGIIAKAFPFLNLRCQLFDGETCTEGVKPVIEYKVEKGKVICYKPVEVLEYPRECRDFAFLSPGGERGCTIEEFIQAVNYVKKKYKKKK